MPHKILLTGATGMVGGHVLDICLDHEEINEVVSLVRKPTGRTHPKLTEVITPDLVTYQAEGDELKNISACFFCIGIYTGGAPADLFRKVTTDMPVALGKLLLEHSPQVAYCLLSGQGADRTEKSRMMFARDKGAAENQLAAIGLGRFHTFRPGYIYPVVKRKEPNISYRIFRSLYPILGPLMGKNGSIPSLKLAEGMIRVGLNPAYPKEVLENRDIREVVEAV